MDEGKLIIRKAFMLLQCSAKILEAIVKRGATSQAIDYTRRELVL
jgi:hypothetical protein